MQCAQCRDRLPEFAEGELAPREAERLRTHLETCAACGAELAAWNHLRAAVTTAPLPGEGPDAPPWEVFEARVLAHARDRRAPRRWLAGWLQPLAAGAAVAGLVLVFGTGRGQAPTPVSTEPPVAVAATADDEYESLAAGLDLAWDGPLSWDTDFAETDSVAMPMLLAEVSTGEASDAPEWSGNFFGGGTDDMWSDLEALDADAFEAFLEALRGTSAS